MNPETGAIYVNGQVVEGQGHTGIPALETIPFPVKVPEGQIFVLGDNPSQSMDSRYAALGFVPVQNITGVAKIKICPDLKEFLIYVSNSKKKSKF